MQAAPESIQLAASFDWEALLPVLFFLLYGIAQLLSSKKKKQQQEEGVEEDGDAMERARQIREEIRRRIEERKREAQGGTAPVSQPAYDPTLPDNRQIRPQPQQRTWEQPRPTPVRPDVSQQRTYSESRPVVQPAPGPNLEELLVQQRKRVVESQRKQREARAKAVEIERKAVISRRKKATVAETLSGDLRTDLLAGLRHSGSIRQAILYREILGKPLGLR